MFRTTDVRPQVTYYTRKRLVMRDPLDICLPVKNYSLHNLPLPKSLSNHTADIFRGYYSYFVGCGIIITEQVGCRTMSALRTPTRLIQTLFFVPGKALHIFSKFNPLNTETR